MKKHLCNPPSHYGKYGEYTRETCALYLDTTSQFQQCPTQHSKQGITQGVPHRSLCLELKPFRVYRKLSPYAVVKKRMGDQRGTKVAHQQHSDAVGEKAHLGTK